MTFADNLRSGRRSINVLRMPTPAVPVVPHARPGPGAAGPGPAPDPAPRRVLGLLDAASIIVGIIIGAGFHHSASTVAAMSGSVGVAMVVWAAGGLIALVGAACYAELATLFPGAGGDYEYLTRAYGRPVGFLFAWTALWVVRPGNIGAMAMVFAAYATRLAPGFGTGGVAKLAWAAAAVGALTAVNAGGIRGGRLTQNLLTGAKVLGLLLLIGVAVFGPAAPAASAGGVVPAGVAAATSWPTAAGLGLAVVLVLFAYGGWSDVAYVAAEVRDPSRTLWRALLLGTGAVTAIYLLAAAGFFRALGYAGVAGSDAVAAAVLGQALGPAGERAISLFVCVACLGAINGMVLTGARVFYAAGRDHASLRWLAAWDGRRGVPTRSLLVQSGVTLALLAAFGWYPDGFDRLVVFTGPPFWVFFLLTGVAVFVFRAIAPAAARPFRVPLYPWTPLLFCASSAYLVYASIAYAVANRAWESWWTVACVAVGAWLAAAAGRQPFGGVLEEARATAEPTAGGE